VNAKSVQQPAAQSKPGKQRQRNTQQEDAWYKRYPRDFHDGTRALTLEERGAYSDIVDMIFILGRPLPDKSDSIAHELHVSTRTWNRVRAALLNAGKLYVTADGCLSNQRADEELAERRKSKEMRAERLTNSELTADERPNKPRSTGVEQELVKKNVIEINDRLPPQAPYARASLESDTDTEEERRKSLPASVEVRPRERASLGLDHAEAIKTLAEWISPFAPDYETASKNLKEVLADFGEEVVRMAFLDMRIAKNSRKNYTNPWKVFAMKCGDHAQRSNNKLPANTAQYKTARERRNDETREYQDSLLRNWS